MKAFLMYRDRDLDLKAPLPAQAPALPEKAGVAAIPMSAFCDPAAANTELWNHLVRFTFAKRDGTLDEAIRRLAVLRDGSATC